MASQMPIALATSTHHALLLGTCSSPTTVQLVGLVNDNHGCPVHNRVGVHRALNCRPTSRMATYVFCRTWPSSGAATELDNDNMFAIILSKDPQFYAHTKHIQRKYHFVCNDLIAKGEAIVRYVPTDHMVADIFTKALPHDKHWKFVAAMGLRLCLRRNVKINRPGPDIQAQPPSDCLFLVSLELFHSTQLNYFSILFIFIFHTLLVL
jgi:hypothetical protein